MIKYFFILGSNPTLSIAELAAVFNHAGRLSLAQANVAILEADQKINSGIIKKIGGVIKFGLIRNELNYYEIKEILAWLADFAKPASGRGKFRFGFSHYGKNKLNLKILAMEFKKLLKQSGINSRWVTSREPVLSSVVAEQNKLSGDRGIEIVIIQSNGKLLLGKTLAVQPFKELSFRDYGRPARDSRSGLLPPKLAQIMINLASADLTGLILDPFCGSGTVLTEAILMGYRNVAGADISEKAINDTKQNLAWVEKNYKIQSAGWRTKYIILNTNATELSKRLAPNSIDAIITEPYLGPPRGKFNPEKVAEELNKLYSRSLTEFKKILKPGGRIVMAWPVFQAASLSSPGGRQKFLNPDLTGFKIINPVPENLRKNAFIKLTVRNTVIYGRQGQKIWREIVALET